MSVDRYLGASRPLSRIQFRTKKYAWTLSAATWIASIVLCAPLWFISQSYGGQGRSESDTQKCYFLESEDSSSAHLYKLFTIYAFLLGFAIPLAIISAANFAILRHVKRRKENKDHEQLKINISNQEMFLFFEYEKFMQLKAVVWIEEAISKMKRKTNSQKIETNSELQNIWEQQGMQTLHDFLKWYNSKDVEPIL
ncbi:somatostatin receptor type 2-like [Convolutriloba macropyga]|uniref:somatostatin receptor type 2-like n=1 Tax=Convolutriloba macropyga TaxID=536237 RepID=UPI003F52792B